MGEKEQSRSYAGRRIRQLRTGDGSSVPLQYEKLQEHARAVFQEEEYTYVSSGAGREATVAANRDRFHCWDIVPRVLRDVADRDLSIRMFDQEFDLPLYIPPMALHLAQEEGEIAAANVAASMGVPLVVNAEAAISLEEIAEQVPDAPLWFQAYWFDDREVMGSLIDRAEQAGYGAIVLTVDDQYPRWSVREFEHNWSSVDESRGLPNYFEDPVFRSRLETSPESNPGDAITYMHETGIDRRLTWDDLSFLTDRTSLPVLLKGILHPEDAQRALEYDVNGIIVSNHGGRVLDGAIAAIDALPDIATVVNGKMPVLFDSGVRTGSDAFKALALGADMVGIGRPLLYGLAINGERGMTDVLLNVAGEFDSIVGLTGHSRVDEISKTVVQER